MAESELVLDGEKYLMKLHDTGGEEDNDRFRQLVCSWADVFILCFSMDRHYTFENIFDKWYPQLRPFNKPIILVGKL